MLLKLHDTGLARFSSISVTRFAILQQFLCQEVVRLVAAMLAMELVNRAKAANIRKLFLLLCATAYRGPAKLFRDLKKGSKRAELIPDYAEIARYAKPTIAICQVAKYLLRMPTGQIRSLLCLRSSASWWQMHAGM